MKTLVQKANAILDSTSASLQSPFLLFVRLYWGWQFAVTGWGKLNNLDKVTGFFTSLGIPFPALNAPFVAGLEFFGGIALALGLFSRPVALLLFIDMVVAYLTADREAFFSLISDPDKFTGATPYNFFFASLIILAFGPGKLALDSLLSRFLRPASARS